MDLRLLPQDGALVLLVQFPLLIDELALFLYFVEEHGVDEVVAHCLGDAVLVEDHEFRSHLGHFFGHQAVLPGVRLVVLEGCRRRGADADGIRFVARSDADYVDHTPRYCRHRSSFYLH